ncbi:MAG TPA: O-antigen ligase family protein, partial [Ignavibacteria bacterium]|nr:O-antigen ligase family protein [Ignavibacteria bacterium]
SLTIPSIHFLNDISVKIFIFISVLTIGFTFSKLVSLKINTPGFLEFLFLMLLTAFCITCFYINLENNLNSYSLFSILTYVINFVLFFFILGKNFRINTTKFDKFTDIIIYFAIVLSLISLIFYIQGIHFLSLYSHTSAGLFGHPNTTSMFYTISIPVLFYKYFTKRISNVVFTCLLILFLSVLLLTLSRAGYIGVGVGILIYTFYKSRTLFVFVSILVAIVAMTIVLDFASSKVDSSASRLLLILSAISVITRSNSSLMWGYGPVNGTNIFIQEKFFFGNEPVPNPHNLLLQLSIQFGLIFTLLAVLTVIVLFVKGMILKFRDERFKYDQRLSLCLTIMLSLIVQNFFEDVLVNPIYYVMPVFFIFSGFVYYSIKLKNKFIPVAIQ